MLVTRPEPGATETAARLTAMGFVPVVAPMLEIHPMPARLPPALGIGAILMASGNAAGSIPEAYHDIPVLTVGDATAARARAAGFTDVTSADGDATALIALVQARRRPTDGTLLLAAGEGQSRDLAQRLRTAGYRVVRRVVYAARPASVLPQSALAALMDKNLQIVLFFSRETALHFMRLVRAAGLIETLRGREAVTIGAQACMALEGAPWSRIRVASQPNQQEMLALLR